MWNLPRPGLEPVSPALAGRFSTTAPPGKPWLHSFACDIHLSQHHLLKIFFSWLNSFGFLIENKLTIDTWIYFWTLNFIPFIYVCPYTSTTMFWLLLFHSSFDSGKYESSNIFSSFSRLFWLFWVPCNFIWILESVYKFLQRSQLGFW